LIISPLSLRFDLERILILASTGFRVTAAPPVSGRRARMQEGESFLLARRVRTKEGKIFLLSAPFPLCKEMGRIAVML
jgi:hypothetical protein